MVILAPFEPLGTLSTISFLARWLQNAPEPFFVSFALVCTRAVPDVFFPIIIIIIIIEIFKVA